ncbi:hypothetical protein CRUP_030667 [Coryphaenoides rupestris]|nr:hypothetical protein CRUP_030667 [Coryphaenoides rupestris]
MLVEGGDLLVFVFVEACDQMVGLLLAAGARGSTDQGIEAGPQGLTLISDIIGEKMGIDVSVLMGANIANEVAAEKFCETTIGSKVLENGLLFKQLLQTPNFRVTAAVIRLGLMEMITFARLFSSADTATFLESCGVADLIASCYGGRNRRVAEAFARTGKSMEELERDLLNGQKLQGPATAEQVHRILQQKGLMDRFPLFTAVYQICYEGRPLGDI